MISGFSLKHFGSREEKKKVYEMAAGHSENFCLGGHWTLVKLFLV